MTSGTETMSACVFAEPIFGPDEIQWHGMAFAGGATVNDITGSDRTVVLDDCLCALASAGIGTSEEAEVLGRVTSALHQAQQERDRLREIAAQMADTLRGVLVVVDQDKPYSWEGGALKQQIREDITAYELLGLDRHSERQGDTAHNPADDAPISRKAE